MGGDRTGSAEQFRELPRSRLPIWPTIRFLYRRLPWVGRLTPRAVFRLPTKWSDVIFAEVAHGVLGAWRARDVETLLAVYDKNAVIDMSRYAGWPDRPVYQGSEGVRQFFTDWDAAWSEFGFRPRRLLTVDAETFLVEIEFEGRGGGSGIEVKQRFFQVAETRKGLVTRMANYTEEREAFEAAGL